MAENPRPHLVTDQDLERQLSKFATKWEVRALIAFSVLAGRAIPVDSLSQSAYHVASNVPGLF